MLAYPYENKIYPIAIDNSGLQNALHVRYGELPFVRKFFVDELDTDDWDKPFPFDAAQVADYPVHNNLKKQLGDKLPELFYKRIKTYRKQPLKYIIYQSGFWIQYHAFDENFDRSFVGRCSQEAAAALEKLSLETLREIFSDAKGLAFSEDARLQKILERRDELLAYKG